MTTEGKLRRERGHNWWIGGCPTGKRGYLDRRAAKAVARVLPPDGGRRVHVYACTECSNWHVGHIPTSVMRGRVDRSRITPPTPKEDR